jgi:hypothetical protein
MLANDWDAGFGAEVGLEALGTGIVNTGSALVEGVTSFATTTASELAKGVIGGG